ncbi:MAG: hypothetical protein IPM29_21240 [Planctomycetes bacterium]|nr:hypothetical protein [Planctomycetota bacterium]
MTRDDNGDSSWRERSAGYRLLRQGASGGTEARRELEGPLALVIVGGLASSTLLNFLLLPALCRRFGRFGPRGAVGDPQAVAVRAP